MKSTSHSAVRNPSDHHGTVLLVVLVVIVLISLGAYSFSELMLSEYQASDSYGRRVQGRVYAEAAIEFAAAQLESEDADAAPNYYHNPELFQAVLMKDSDYVRTRGRFSIVTAVENDPNSSRIRFGLVNESSKLNLNTLLQLELSEEEVRDVLMKFPNMTEDIADSIMDWIDDDDEAREFGNESEYYAGLSTPYAPRNGPLESLDELLMVAGVTQELLFGEDGNRNGLLDPNENDGSATPPIDNEDDVLQVGWVEYFTVHAKESNLRSDGSPKIHVNSGILTDVYDQLVEELGEDEATFIVAFRLVGPVDDGTTDETIESATDVVAEIAGMSPAEQEAALQKLAGEIAQGLFSAAQGAVRNSGGSVGSSGGGAGTSGTAQSSKSTVTRNGLDLAGGATVEIGSLYDLVDTKVEIEQDGKMVTLESPFTTSSLEATLPEIMNVLSITDSEEILGRIDTNQARYETLRGVPGMTDTLCDSIMASSLIGTDGSALTDALSRRATNGWILIEGLVDLPTMRKLDKYLTTKGDVFRGQAIGHFDAGGPVTRLEFVIDASVFPARTLSVRDISELGRGFPNSMLMPATGQ
ncbi:MAG: type II secretion system protein GspK [Planctomycetota bacterium]|nr:type II secretion system protein GspK [Planctomycetota bacterium]